MRGATRPQRQDGTAAARRAARRKYFRDDSNRALLRAHCWKLDHDVRVLLHLRLHLLIANAHAPAEVREPLIRVHEPVAGVNCHKSLSVPTAPVGSMP